INVTVTDHSPQRAQAVASSLGQAFSSFVTSLESAKGEKSPVRVSVTSAPRLPTSPVSPKKPVYLVLGALLGFLLGVVVAVLREVSSRSRMLAPSVPSARAPSALMPGPQDVAFREARMRTTMV